MSMYGRNEPCPCGSGKKYKKCCMNKEQDVLDTPITSLREAALKVNVANPAVPSHDSAKGIRELCLAQLEQVFIYLRRQHKKDGVIETICSDLVELAEEPENKFITVWKEIYEIKGLSDHQIGLQVPRLRELIRKGEKLSLQERTLLKQLMESNLAEFMLLSDVETMDYGAMLVLTELCYNIIKVGIPENKIIESITVYVGSGNKLESWNVTYEPKLYVLNEASLKTEQYIHIEWIPLDEFEHEYESFVHKLHGLSEESKSL
ncbi:YecA family protein [Paenibacillus sp. JSM ZJ436]|uniref:YecA family protein n=1 Tax=Paenibacillus sp. JSM ZJ436 TaxID=3376190 RepID=UPI00379E2D65